MPRRCVLSEPQVKLPIAMDTVDTILKNFGQWCEVEGSAMASEITLVVFQIDGTERGRFRIRRNAEESETPLYISTSAGTLIELAAGEREPQLAFLDGSLRLARFYLFHNRFACEQIATRILGPILLQRI